MAPSTVIRDAMPRLKAMGTPIKSNTMKYPKRSMMALSCSKRKTGLNRKTVKRTANKESVARMR